MQIVDLSDPFSLVDVSEFVVPPLPKPIDTRGYIYIITDTVYLDYFKIGRTIDVNKRLQTYNSDKPFKSTSIYAVSLPFHNAVEVESKIVKAMYKVTSPTTFSKEWFLIDYLDHAVELIKEAEQIFKLMEV